MAVKHLPPGFIAAGEALNIVSFDPAGHDARAEAADDRSLNQALRRRRVRSEILRIPVDANDATIVFLGDVIAALSGRRLILLVRDTKGGARMLGLMQRLCDLGAATLVIVIGNADWTFAHERASVYYLADDACESIESLADALLLNRNG